MVLDFATVLVVSLIGAALGFGALNFIPGAKAASWLAGLVFLLIIVGMFLASIGAGQLSGFLASWPRLSAFGVGFAAGGIIAGLVGR